MKIFGCSCVAYEPMELHEKKLRFLPYTTNGIFLGVRYESKEYMVLTADGKIRDYSTVRFFESSILNRDYISCTAEQLGDMLELKGKKM